MRVSVCVRLKINDYKLINLNISFSERSDMDLCEFDTRSFSIMINIFARFLHSCLKLSAL